MIFNYVDEIENAIYDYLLNYGVLDKVRKWVSILGLAMHINKFSEGYKQRRYDGYQRS